MPEGVPPKLDGNKRDGYDPTKRFMGEMMNCEGCKKREKSSKKRESNWTYIQFDEHEFYLCPKCFDKGEHIAILQRITHSRKNG